MIDSAGGSTVTPVVDEVCLLYGSIALTGTGGIGTVHHAVTV
ncbi:hypothetical protein [Sphingomonas montana]|nr:hypothetical protein [Sphingomonas montana]